MAETARPDERRDPYAVLGVARDADAEAIKSAYRRLARELHPDVSDRPDAEERFKEVTRAHQVLSDPERRRLYDEFGEIALDPGFDAEKAREMADAFGAGFGRSGGFGPFEGFDGFAGFGSDPRSGGGTFASGDWPDWLEELLGGAGGAGSARPHPFGAGAHRRPAGDLEAELEIDLREAVLGGERRLTVARPHLDGSGTQSETLRVRIPAGVEDGGRIRLAGKGAVGPDGRPAGDLRVRLRVRPDPRFERRGRDLVVEVPITVSEAMLGAEIEIPTLEGRVKLQVPAGTDGGTRLRLRGKGVAAGRGHEAGDLYARLRIRVPRDLDERERRAAEALADAGPAGVRDELLGDG